ncbi:MAG: hypothetical protein CMA08_02620 [Euryarchaeota archaeon]|nr:hypothetical protein [Euryarchaeota archaeon]OUX22528.1 MAG: hypothetical protein CBE12_02010 [Euryarchaeota archaeon TMED252]
MGDKWQKAKVSKFVVGENGLEIKGEYCSEPQCGDGIFLAVHGNRKSCGRCGYTVMEDGTVLHESKKTE